MSNHQQNVSQKLQKAVERELITQADAFEILIQAMDDPESANDLISKMSLKTSNPRTGFDESACEDAQCDDATIRRSVNRVTSPNADVLEQDPVDDATIAGGFRNRNETGPAKRPSVGKGDSNETPWPTRSVSSKSASTFNKQTASGLSASTPPSVAQTRTSSIKSGFARYEIREEIGRGGCGVVSLAFDRQLQRLVVVKQIVNQSAGSETAERFLNEAQITGQLEHPGIVSVYEMGEAPNGLPFYAMKFLDGETLADVISKHRAMPEGETKRQSLRRILQRYLDICNTLAFSHENGIIHRDLKPANVMVGQFGETVVLDWGLARRIEFRPSKQLVVGQEQTQTKASNGELKEPKTDEALDSFSQFSPTSMTMQGTILGTAAYMAPEQAKGNISQLDRRSDVFSLGVILYEILSGKSPFRGDTLHDTIENVTNGRCEKLRSIGKRIPKPLAAICEKAMHLDQESRYENAGFLASDIEAYLSGHAINAYQESWFERLDRTAERYRTVFRSIFAATIIIALVASIAVGKVSHSYQSEKSARQLAVAAKDETDEALGAESEAKEVALQRLAIARGSIDNWLIQLSGDLQFYPGLEPIRNQLIRSGEDFYQQLWESSNKILDSETKRPDSERNTKWLADETLELAKNSIRLGDLARLQNELATAKEHYSAAKKSLLSVLPKAKVGQEGSSQQKRNDRDFSQHSWKYLQLANANIGLELCNHAAELEGTATKNQSKKQQPASLMETENVLSNLVRSSPRNSSFRNALARTKLVQGRFLESNGLRDKAIEAYQAGLLDTEILIQHSDEPRHVELKMNLLRSLAQAHLAVKNDQAAITALEKLSAFLERRIDETQPRPDWLEEQSWTATMLGQVYAKLGQSKSSIQEFKTANQFLDAAQAQLFGSPSALENKFAISSSRGLLHKQNDEFNSAESELKASVAQLRSLIQAYGATTERIQKMSLLYMSIGEVLLRSKTADAAPWFEQNQTLLDHLESQENGKDFAKKAKALTALIQAESFAANEDWKKCESHLSTAFRCYSIFEQDTTYQLNTVSDEICSQDNFDRHFIRARMLRLVALSKTKLANGKQTDQFASAFHEFVSKLPPHETTHSCANFILRTYCEFSRFDSKCLRLAVDYAEQISKRFDESHSIWFSVAATRLMNGQYREAEEAMQQVKFFRIEATPTEEMLDCLLLYHAARIPTAEWKARWERALSNSPPNPWRDLLSHECTEIPE